MPVRLLEGDQAVQEQRESIAHLVNKLVANDSRESSKHHIIML